MFRWLQTFIIRRRTTNLNISRDFCKTLDSVHQLKENPYYEKYADKIVAFQKASPEDFKLILEGKHTNVKEPSFERADATSKASSPSKSHKFHCQKGLEQIMKTDTLKDKTAEEIKLIWNQYHQSRDGIYAVLPSDSYKKMYSKSRTYPVFLLPLPRAQGYEFIMLQFLDRSCFFTSLINYQAFKENAPICLTITYFTEFQAEKGIVLMRGEYDDKALRTQEAQCLANQLQLYYGGTDEKKDKLLWTFNKQPETFRHMDLVSNFEYSFGSGS